MENNYDPTDPDWMGRQEELKFEAEQARIERNKGLENQKQDDRKQEDNKGLDERKQEDNKQQEDRKQADDKRLDERKQEDNKQQEDRKQEDRKQADDKRQEENKREGNGDKREDRSGPRPTPSFSDGKNGPGFAGKSQIDSLQAQVNAAEGKRSPELQKMINAADVQQMKDTQMHQQDAQLTERAMTALEASGVKDGSFNFHDDLTGKDISMNLKNGQLHSDDGKPAYQIKSEGNSGVDRAEWHKDGEITKTFNGETGLENNYQNGKLLNQGEERDKIPELNKEPEPMKALGPKKEPEPMKALGPKKEPEQNKDTEPSKDDPEPELNKTEPEKEPEKEPEPDKDQAKSDRAEALKAKLRENPGQQNQNDRGRQL